MKLIEKIRNAIKKTLAKKDKRRQIQTLTHGDSRKIEHDDDYVGEDELNKISGDRRYSLFTCDMPEEKLAKIKSIRSSVSGMSEQTFSLADINSRDTVMGRVRRSY